MITREPGSFRDNLGYVFKKDGRIFRLCDGSILAQTKELLESNFFKDLVKRGWLVETELVDSYVGDGQGDKFLLEHKKIDFFSFPYEWSFEYLKSAALLHLDIQIYALDNGYVLRDSSAYNLTYVKGQPIFIDILSFKPYEIDERWTGYSQFCNQFLNPLVLKARYGVDFNNWYRGSMRGVDSALVNKFAKMRDIFNPNFFIHIFLPNILEKYSDRNSVISKKLIEKKFQKDSYRSLLVGLKKYVQSLKRLNKKTTWSDYNLNNIYGDKSYRVKKEIVSEFCARNKPQSLIDVGCNSGDFAIVAISAGVAEVIGFDNDFGALGEACLRANELSIPFTPLYLDATNQSASQGWNQMERSGFNQRFRAHAVIALAFIHHLVIANNIPLEYVIEWIINIAPIGLIEFVPIEDATIQKMLEHKPDIYKNYNLLNMLSLLEAAKASIVKITDIGNTGRCCIEFKRIDK